MEHCELGHQLNGEKTRKYIYSADKKDGKNNINSITGLRHKCE